MKKVLCLFLTLALCLSLPLVVHAKAFDAEETLHAPYIAVYNTENGHFVYRKNADEKTLPSSSAKIMTGILALEHFEGRLDTKVTVTSAALRGLEGSAVLNLKAEEEIPVRDLLYAMLVAGMNDAANVLAIEVGGSIQNFVTMMNRRAAELGAENTLYLNPTGFDNASAYTTAEDTARIAAHAYKNATFMQMCSARAYTVPATNMHAAVTVYTRNSLVSTQSEYFYKEADGISSGRTEMGGYAIISASDAGNYPYVCVAMGGDVESYTDVKKLLAWADNNFLEQKLLDPSKIVAELPVLAGRSDHVLIVPQAPVYVFLDGDTDLGLLTYSAELNCDELTAPVKKGGIVGTITLILDGEPIASTHLVTKTEVRKSAGGALLLSLKRTVTHPVFIIAVILLMLLTALTLYKKYFIYHHKKGRNHHGKTRNEKGRAHQ
ncbi:MAG: D-alanyl-D-alanine carboxypeptidase [Clostridia bacterium]|nr:D-alanyl-D-alanine carboxypeptidase [Clostridia bacterium]